MLRTLCFGLLLAGTCAVIAQERPVFTAPNPPTVLPGQIVPSVRSAAKPEQSYALYVPSNYVPGRAWPIVYVFDPAARGLMPLELMKDAAERYGFLLAGSNNSRNGARQPEQEAAQEMWRDTHERLTIDDRRVYFAGHSGGARVAAELAQACHCAHGVFLNGAGFAAGDSPSRKTVFSVFSTAGMNDFNYGELLELDARLDALGFHHFFRRFDGDHAWAPAEVWDEALAWMTILEMKSSLRPRDGAFVAAELARAAERASKREDAGEPSFALSEYRAIVASFVGLADTEAIKERIGSLEKNPATRAAAKQEKAEIEKQRTLETGFLRLTDAIRDGTSDQAALRLEALNKVRGWRNDMVREKRPSERRVLERVLGSVFVAMFEMGGQFTDAGQYRTSVTYLQLAAEARPNSPTIHLRLARCHALMGDDKEALRDLKLALDSGFSPDDLAKFVKANPKLAALVDTPEYRKLLEGGRPISK
jgi:hypothetical protein